MTSAFGKSGHRRLSPMLLTGYQNGLRRVARIDGELPFLGTRLLKYRRLFAGRSCADAREGLPARVPGFPPVIRLFRAPPDPSPPDR